MSEDIKTSIFRIIQNFFPYFEGPITDSISADDIEEWDSLTHVQIVLLIEQTFGIRFTLSEINSMQNLGDLRRVVEIKCHSK